MGTYVAPPCPQSLASDDCPRSDFQFRAPSVTKSVLFPQSDVHSPEIIFLARPNDHSRAGCPGQSAITTAQTLTMGTYLANADCVWYITAPAFNKVRLTFTGGFSIASSTGQSVLETHPPQSQFTTLVSSSSSTSYSRSSTVVVVVPGQGVLVSRLCPSAHGRLPACPCPTIV